MLLFVLTGRHLSSNEVIFGEIDIMRDKRRDLSFLMKMPGTVIFILSLTLYVIVTFIFHYVKSYNIGAANYLDAGELFAFSENAPFWDHFSLVLPLVCIIPSVGLYDYICKNTVISKICCKEKDYIVRITKILPILIFAIVMMECFLSLLLNGIRFSSTGITFDDFKLSMAYVKNMGNGDKYAMCRLHMYHPLLYNLIYSVLFSLLCAVISYTTTSFLNSVKRVKKYVVYIISMIISLMIYKVYEIFNINLWHFYIVSQKTYKNVILSAIFLIILIFSPRIGEIVKEKKAKAFVRN